MRCQEARWPALILGLLVSAAAAEPVSKQGLSFSGSFRSRFETLDGEFRRNRVGSDQLLTLRTDLRLDLSRERWFAQAELIDARAYLASDDTPLNTTLINALEPVNAHVGLRLGDDEAAGGVLRLGWQTLDLGSRRLVARNRWRNTTNAFLGASLDWHHATGSQTKAFAVSTMNRLPNDRAGLRDNDIELDDASAERRFVGLFHAGEGLGRPLELWALHLDEGDAPGAPSANRRLWTLGFRVRQAAGRQAWDWELESAVQFGRARATRLPADATDLDVRAHFEHLSVGYRFDAALEPRLALDVDYASGDADPEDDRFGAFDQLFGAAVGDLGPRGLFGAFNRSNLLLVGGRLDWRLPADVDGSLRIRQASLAERRDRWRGTLLGDPAGAPRDLGVQTELQFRWRPAGKHHSVAGGLAWLAKGAFQADPDVGTNEQGDSVYGWFDLSLAF
jgi:hypothetical protein